MMVPDASSSSVGLAVLLATAVVLVVLPGASSCGTHSEAQHMVHAMNADHSGDEELVVHSKREETMHPATTDGDINSRVPRNIPEETLEPPAANPLPTKNVDDFVYQRPEPAKFFMVTENLSQKERDRRDLLRDEKSSVEGEVKFETSLDSEGQEAETDLGMISEMSSSEEKMSSFTPLSSFKITTVNNLQGATTEETKDTVLENGNSLGQKDRSDRDVFLVSVDANNDASKELLEENEESKIDQISDIPSFERDIRNDEVADVEVSKYELTSSKVRKFKRNESENTPSLNEDEKVTAELIVVDQNLTNDRNKRNPPNNGQQLHDALSFDDFVQNILRSSYNRQFPSRTRFQSRPSNFGAEETNEDVGQRYFSSNARNLGQNFDTHHNNGQLNPLIRNYDTIRKNMHLKPSFLPDERRYSHFSGHEDSFPVTALRNYNAARRNFNPGSIYSPGNDERLFVPKRYFEDDFSREREPPPTPMFNQEHHNFFRGTNYNKKREVTGDGFQEIAHSRIPREASRNRPGMSQRVPPKMSGTVQQGIMMLSRVFFDILKRASKMRPRESEEYLTRLGSILLEYSRPDTVLPSSHLKPNPSPHITPPLTEPKEVLEIPGFPEPEEFIKYPEIQPSTFFPEVPPNFRPTELQHKRPMTTNTQIKPIPEILDKPAIDGWPLNIKKLLTRSQEEDIKSRYTEPEAQIAHSSRSFIPQAALFSNRKQKVELEPEEFEKDENLRKVLQNMGDFYDIRVKSEIDHKEPVRLGV